MNSTAAAGRAWEAERFNRHLAADNKAQSGIVTSRSAFGGVERATRPAYW